ncbi:ATP-grasp domain-containing protein [Streptomyces canus]|uniref:ATP-grasp domain-containing protein n=1 Tax=Streptomyces canus TaxID=58343 RepID=UPI002E27FAE2|nr:ATP-grasp domain-containing protein [Streptomyces canus]
MTARVGPPSLLFVGGASPLPSSVHLATEMLTQARARGIETHLVNKAEVLEATREVCELADAVHALDPDRPEDCVRWARDRAAEGLHFDAVLGLRDPVQFSAAELTGVFGAAGNPIDAVRRVRNKDACREALAAAGFRQPSVWLCSDLDDAARALRESAGPWVVKPRDGLGSIGVRLVTGPEDLARAVDELPTQDPFLVEGFVTGPEFSVEGVFVGGGAKVLAITAKEKLPPPYFVELGHVLPAELPEETRKEIDQEVTAALDALDLRFGVFHVELWLTQDGVVLGEVHARPGGDWLHRLLTYAIPGLEFFGPVFDDLLGRPPGPLPVATRAAAVRFLAPPPGRLLRIDGWERVASHPAVLYAGLFVEPGGVIRPVRDSGDRAGVVVVGAETPARALELAAELARSVEFEVEPAGGA